MGLITQLNGTWTWDGSTLVLSDNTSQVVAGDYVRMDPESPAFKIQTVNPGVSVAILNPDLLAIPSGSGAQKTDEPIRNEIVQAGDVAQVDEHEIVTQPGNQGGDTVPYDMPGTWAFNGTTTVAASDTSKAAAGKWICMTGNANPFKIVSVDPNVSVTIENPNSLTIPSGSGAQWILVRPTKQKYQSPTIHPTKKYQITPQYLNPVSSPAWGAQSGTDEAVVAA